MWWATPAPIRPPLSDWSVHSMDHIIFRRAGQPPLPEGKELLHDKNPTHGVYEGASDKAENFQIPVLIRC